MGGLPRLVEHMEDTQTVKKKKSQETADETKDADAAPGHVLPVKRKKTWPRCLLGTEQR